MFPIDQKELRKRMIQLLKLYFKDNQKASILLPSGKYVRKKPEKGEPFIRVQHVLYQEMVALTKNSEKVEKKEFLVRRKYPEELPR